MDSIGQVLVFIKNSILFIVTELKQLEKMNHFISNNILTYELAINNLLDSIQNLNNPLYNQIVNPASLCSILALINSHVLSLNKLVTRMNKWNSDVKKGGFKKIKALIKDRPSVLSQELFTKLLEIKPLLFEIANIEKETLGSGVRIKNPLLRASWVLSGRNQVNDSSIDKNIIAENIYLLLKQELGGEIKKPVIWKAAINRLLDNIDGCAAGSKDSKISISEMNEFTSCNKKSTFKELLTDYLDKETAYTEGTHKEPVHKEILQLEYKPNATESSEENTEKESSDKEVLQLEYKPETNNGDVDTANLEISESNSEDSNEVDSDRITIVESIPEMKEESIIISLDFTKKEINYKHKVEMPKASGYGGDWPSTKLCTFRVPNTNYKNLEFEYLDILFEAGDQGWGGTGHDNIRYQIDDGEAIFGLFIDRVKSPDGRYKLTLNWEKVEPGTTITLWLVCAPFGGWSARVSSIKAIANFTLM